MHCSKMLAKTITKAEITSVREIETISGKKADFPTKVTTQTLADNTRLTTKITNTNTTKTNRLLIQNIAMIDFEGRCNDE